MSESSLYHPSFEVYNNDYAKQQLLQQQQQGLDNFFSFQSDSPSDVLAPHPDLFESELDLISADLDPEVLHLLAIEPQDAFSFLRSDTPTCGPPSTVASESAYDSVSSRSESFYNYPRSSYHPTSNYSFPVDLEMDFQRIAVGDYNGSQNIIDSTDPSSFGALPPTPPRSPHHTHPNGKLFEKTFETRGSFSDYGPARRSSSSDYYYNHGHPGRTVSPGHVSGHQLPIVPSISLVHPTDDYKGDPRKKYKCNVCPRGIFFSATSLVFANNII